MRPICLIAMVMIAGSLIASAASDVVTVDGGQLRGRPAGDVRVFKGIPFAAPPVGGLRWKVSQPVVAWSGVRAADTFGAQCTQPPYSSDSPYPSAAQPTSEDCLYLNVWTAARPNDRRPVMVWIHGDAWTGGSGSTSTYDGAVLAKKGVVVVTTNYRLGALGFFAHPQLTRESSNHASGNYGILDQIAALKWVQRNIATFGGDPSRVTIFGESAGSWSVNVLQATPLAKGLFHRAIGESGGQFAGTQSLTQAERHGVAAATAVGAPTLADLRALPAEKLLGIEEFRTGVNVDGYVLSEDVRSIFAHGNQNNVPVLVGSNANEMTTVSDVSTFPTSLEEYRRRMAVRFPGFSRQCDAVYPVRTEADIPGALLTVGRDQTFAAEMRTWARMVTAAGQKAFLYEFTHVPPSPNAKTWGAYHGSEIAYVFGTLHNRDWSYTRDDFKLSDEMSRYWVNFARAGDPNGTGLPAWRQYDHAEEPYLEFGDTIRTRNHLLKAQLDFLDDAALRRRSVSR